MNSSDLLLFLSQRRDVIESFYLKCQTDQDVSVEIDMEGLYALFESGILDDVFNRSSTTTYTIRPIQHESLDDSDLDRFFEN